MYHFTVSTPLRPAPFLSTIQILISGHAPWRGMGARAEATKRENLICRSTLAYESLMRCLGASVTTLFFRQNDEEDGEVAEGSTLESG